MKRSDLEEGIVKLMLSIEPLLIRNDWAKLFHVRLRLKRALLSGSTIDLLHELVSYVSNNLEFDSIASQVKGKKSSYFCFSSHVAFFSAKLWESSLMRIKLTSTA